MKMKCHKKKQENYASKEINVSVCSLAQLCLTLCNPIDCSLSGSSVHGIFQAKRPEWAAIKSKTENCFLELYNITDKNF